MQDQLRELIRKHCSTLTQRVGALGEVLQRLPDASEDFASVLHDGREIAHQITGASGSMGFRAISAAAQLLERYLEELGESGGVPPRPAIERVMRLFADLKSTADAATPEGSSLYDADLSHLSTAARAPRQGVS